MPRELVEAAREAIADNRKASSAGNRFWELSGGVLVCGNCGRRMTTCRRRRDSNATKYYHHYRCPKRQLEGADACCHKKNYRAREIEKTVWGVVSDIMRDPEQLQADLDRMIEQERQSMRGYPEKKAETWLRKLSEADRNRSGFQDLAAEGLITLDELRVKLTKLEKTRETAEMDSKSSSNTSSTLKNWGGTRIRCSRRTRRWHRKLWMPSRQKSATSSTRCSGFG
jgi:hypothetical protein